MITTVIGGPISSGLRPNFVVPRLKQVLLRTTRSLTIICANDVLAAQFENWLPKSERVKFVTPRAWLKTKWSELDPNELIVVDQLQPHNYELINFVLKSIKTEVWLIQPPVWKPAYEKAGHTTH